MPKPIPELQNQLFKTLGVGPSNGTGNRGQKAGRGGRAAGRPNLTRKDQRKAQRAQKKSSRYSRDPSAPVRGGFRNPNAAKPRPAGPSQPSSVLKKQPGSSKHTRPRSNEGGGSSEDDFEGAEDGFGEDDDLEDESNDDEGDLSGEDNWDGLEDDDDDDGDNGDYSAGPSSASGAKGNRSRTMRDKLAQDDAEIEALEKKLGIKKGRKSLPQSFKDDGLDLLLGDLGDAGEEDDNGSDGERTKRKRDYDDWLSAKRRKSGAGTPWTRRTDEAEDSEADDLDEDDDSLAFGGEDDSLDDFDTGSFDGFDSESEGSEGRAPAPAQPRQRENPYVAPTTGPVVAKYVPPSLRKSSGGEGEAIVRLRKQVQGLINRLTDANLLSIVQAAEELYQNNARGDVTEVLTDAILAQVCKPESLPDQFFVLTGGFAAAIYKIVGSSFGSHLIRRVVKDFGEEYDKASANQSDESAIAKEPSNIITLLSQLYLFEVVGCKIIFDYMEHLLGDLSEINVELLLRICRNGGRLLRRDDPQALKNVSASLNRAVSKAGYANVSARTKFMVDTINDLRNNKARAKGLDSVVVSEHVVRMKKRLGEIKSQSRRLDGLTPMGVGLDDILKADTRGKWWLVGASVPAKPEQTGRAKQGKGEARDGDGDSENDDDGGGSDADSEDMDFVLPDYPRKARAQGLATPAQIAIFTAVMTAMDFETGYRQYLNLKLRKDDQLEIARVLVQCVGSEAEYNPYYAAVAERACSNNRVRFAFQARLWQIFRAMGEVLFGEDMDDMETADSIRFKDQQRVRRVAQFYASLIMEGALRISILKPLNPLELEPSTSVFLESLVVSLLQSCKSHKPEKERARVEKAFGGALDLPELAAGLDWFLQKKLRKTKLVSSKALKKLDQVKEQAREVLTRGLVEE
ncbi:Suppressor of glycerol defect protein-like protein [Hapsidospora chrysogenum ATCC 11550]|uniref:Suppressor of glycerol defect protein-like protein n=1 Tax=Hapsidospora chrysogenum (strain ATCC 11550 / CBS 779.69 / DSM 880 / IAM 14645 / JCM 23072 / IMI 49137) TaxID=857340 RepID=A0A086T0M4_HAPC1|nr:Suppressor of glycerol defect protein-like protein [Hapsidospora chrysogenum ATCC 11550]